MIGTTILQKWRSIVKTIAIINQKGGVGKTALAYNLAYYFSTIGKLTCLIDLEPSANSTKGLNFKDFNLYVGDLFTTLNSYFDPESCLYPIKDCLNIIPSKINLAMVQRDLASKTYRETILDRQLRKIGIPHDYIFMDCPPMLSELTVNAIYAANFILIPVTYEDDALEGLNDLFRVINEIKDGKPFGFKIVRNKKDGRKSVTNDYIENKLKPFIEAGHVFTTVIRQDESINQAKIERTSIFQFAPHSNGAHDFKSLAEELINVKA
jgi:chromosome partitioning protein